MTRHDCLNEQDLTLHYYREQTEHADPEGHLQTCATCRDRLAALQEALARIPSQDTTLDEFAASRFAARIAEKTARRSRRWQPLTGGLLAAGTALLLTVFLWPAATPVPTPTVSSQQVANSGPPVSDTDLLENLDLLNELDTLRQLEGV